MRSTIRLLSCLAVVVLACGVWQAFAEAPANVDDVAPIGDLVYEVDAKIKLLDRNLADAEAYEKAREEDVWQAFAVLTVTGQAIAEHSHQAEAGFSGPALREAAIGFKRNTNYDDAQAMLAAVKTARAGGGATDAKVDADWAKLIRMHPMMEEINERNAKLVSVFRRPRGRPDEPVHASTIAVLSLAMLADTHEVKNEADIPTWQEWSKDYREKMIGAANAVREKDGAAARELFDQANETCDACHEKFRDAE